MQLGSRKASKQLDMIQDFFPELSSHAELLRARIDTDSGQATVKASFNSLFGERGSKDRAGIAIEKILESELGPFHPLAGTDALRTIAFALTEQDLSDSVLEGLGELFPDVEQRNRAMIAINEQLGLVDEESDVLVGDDREVGLGL